MQHALHFSSLTKISHETHYTVLSRHPFTVQTHSLALCSQTPSVYVRPLMSMALFSTHTEPQARL
jgi:hypothetical protein